jgi:hypothetical protein
MGAAAHGRIILRLLPEQTSVPPVSSLASARASGAIDDGRVFELLDPSREVF